jgi:hypothetical protein
MGEYPIISQPPFVPIQIIVILFLGSSRARKTYQLAKLDLESINVTTETLISSLVRYFRGCHQFNLHKYFSAF